MRKLTVLLLLVLCFGTVFAQTENGTVYSEHEIINKTKQLWKAFQDGDRNTYLSFFADSIALMRNGNYNVIAKENFGNNVNWWKENIANLSIKDDTPAYPDAIVYKDGGKWVQDWLMITGTHEASGINLELRLHNLYAFNEAGKITMLIQYFDDDVFEDINNSGTVIENGKVFINHPYIVTVRKMVNAYMGKDLKTFMDFYADDAGFSNTAMDWQESINKEEREKDVQQNFADIDDIKFKQIGYPDCVYYAEGNNYTVYSWWEYSFTVKESGKKVVMPIMLSHSFNDDGKVASEIAYFSTNHLED